MVILRQMDTQIDAGEMGSCVLYLSINFVAGCLCYIYIYIDLSVCLSVYQKSASLTSLLSLLLHLSHSLSLSLSLCLSLLLHLSHSLSLTHTHSLSLSLFFFTLFPSFTRSLIAETQPLFGQWQKRKMLTPRRAPCDEQERELQAQLAPVDASPRSSRGDMTEVICV